MKQYGHFSKDGSRFIITNPNTPRPWINYLTNEDYCAIISQCAGGYSFYKDCRGNRILRWKPENWHFDRPGRYVFVKERKAPRTASLRGRQSAKRKANIWSATFQPLQIKPEFYECQHSFGWTSIETTYRKVNTKITYFVPPDEPCEIWLVQLTNQSSKIKELSIYPYIEWLLGDYHLELRYRNIMNLYNRIWWDESLGAILAKKTAAWGDLNIKKFNDLAFFASSLPVRGCAVNKSKFLGSYNDEQKPDALRRDRLGFDKFCSGEDGIAAFEHRLRLLPGESKEFVVVLGQTKGIAKIKGIIQRYQRQGVAKKALEETKEFWRKRILDNVTIHTPDRDLNVLVNGWLKYQMYICNLWSRSPSYYHEGSGGRGFRDSCQDAEGIAAFDSQLTRKRIGELASIIRRDGTSAPGWSDGGPATYRPNKDHPIWLTSTVSAYIKETGDIKILAKHFPYLKDRWRKKGTFIDPNWNKGSLPDGQGTLFEHLRKNLDSTFNDVGRRGLPLIGHADWNDAIDAAGIKGKGESVWLAMALVRSLKLLAELSLFYGKKEIADELSKKAEIMRKRINRVGWDGNWYVRGFTDTGTVYGSRKNKEGRIFLNTQSWAILSGIASKEREKKLLRAVDKYLDTEHGLALFFPAYSDYDPKLGRITMFSEGTKENAAIFCHAASFMIAADCLAGRGDKAYQRIRKIMPNAQENYDLYKTEPYVYAEYLIGREHPYLFGEGAFTWITGTAAWTFLLISEYLLGVQRDFQGLRINPALPRKWKRCKIIRPFRKALYEIEIINKGGKQGAKKIYVDGEKIEGDLIKPHSDGKRHKVRVLIG